MSEELRIKVVADTEDFEKKMDKVGRKVDDTAEKAQKSASRWDAFKAKLSGISPTFSKMSEAWQEQSSKIDDTFGKGTASAKLFKLGVVGALAGIALKAGQVAWKVASETARMFDPQSYSKAAGQMQKSIKKLKTTIGSFTAPLVNGIMTVVSKIVDGITWVLEKVRVGIAFISGVIKTVFSPIIEGVKTVISWIQQGINILSNLLGFGDVFKAPAESAQKTADSMGEVVEATSAGLASFDQLNTIDTGGGDTEQADKLNESMAAASALGEKLTLDLGDFLGNLADGLLDIDLAGLWDGFVSAGEKAWNAIKGFGEKAWNAIKSAGMAIWNGLKTFVTAIWDFWRDYATAYWNALKAVGEAVWNGLKTFVTAIWDFWRDYAIGVWTAFETVGRIAWDALQAIASTAWNLISTPILALWNTFTTLGENAWGLLTTLGETFNRVIIDPIKSAVEWCMEKIQWVLDKIGGVKSFLGGIGDGIGSAIGGVKSFLGLADGGVVKPNNPFPVIVGDNTKEPEVISPLSTIRQAVSEAMAGAGSAGKATASGPIELTVKLDSKTIARAVYDPLKTESRRRGSAI